MAFINVGQIPRQKGLLELLSNQVGEGLQRQNELDRQLGAHQAMLQMDPSYREKVLREKALSQIMSDGTPTFDSGTPGVPAIPATPDQASPVIPTSLAPSNPTDPRSQDMSNAVFSPKTGNTDGLFQGYSDNSAITPQQIPIDPNSMQQIIPGTPATPAIPAIPPKQIGTQPMGYAQAVAQLNQQMDPLHTQAQQLALEGAKQGLQEGGIKLKALPGQLERQETLQSQQIAQNDFALAHASDKFESEMAQAAAQTGNVKENTLMSQFQRQHLEGWKQTEFQIQRDKIAAEREGTAETAKYRKNLLDMDSRKYMFEGALKHERVMANSEMQLGKELGKPGANVPVLRTQGGLEQARNAMNWYNDVNPMSLPEDVRGSAVDMQKQAVGAFTSYLKKSVDNLNFVSSVNDRAKLFDQTLNVAADWDKAHPSHEGIKMVDAVIANAQPLREGSNMFDPVAAADKRKIKYDRTYERPYLNTSYDGWKDWGK